MNKLERENKYPYHNRELSWLEFNKRVLLESLDDAVPLFELAGF